MERDVVGMWNEIRRGRALTDKELEFIKIKKGSDSILTP